MGFACIFLQFQFDGAYPLEFYGSPDAIYFCIVYWVYSSLLCIVFEVVIN